MSPINLLLNVASRNSHVFDLTGSLFFFLLFTQALVQEKVYEHLTYGRQ